jgi:ATP-binding cassette subfamily B protein/ATP-binding cassette subfamily C protein
VASCLFKAITPFVNIFLPKFIIDELTGGRQMDRLIWYTILLITANLILRVLNSTFTKVMETVTEDLHMKMDLYLGEKCVNMDFEHVENPDILDLKEKAYFAIYQLGAINRTLENVSVLIYQGITLIGLGYLLSFLNPLVLIFILGIVFLNSFLFKRIERIRFEDSQKDIYDNRAFGYFLRLASDFSIGKDVRLYNIGPLFLKKMKFFMDNLLRIYSRQFTLIGKYTGLSNVNTQVQTVLIYGYLSWQVLKQQIGLGSFTMYANAVRNFSTSITAFITAIIEINQLCMYLEYFMEFDQLKSRKDQGTISKDVIMDYTIEFKNVSFSYPGKKEYTLKNISITIQPGEKLSVVGLNGAGKTTFIKLLARLYVPTKGEIQLGGVDIQSINYEDYMGLLSIVFQDFKLLSYTIRDNLNIRDGIAEKEQLAALNKAGFENDYKKLDRGLNTFVYKSFDENGVEFSGGQSQKLSIARALCKDAPIVILDEPTSALDPLAEYEVYHSFNSLVEGKTAIYISHRLSSTKFSDNIAVFKDGEMIEYGTHEQLLSDKESLYAVMYNTQAMYYIS